jgi:hypothetical protein
MLLSVSQQRTVLTDLRSALRTAAGASREDILAAIDAIESQNPNYFVDRDHSGKIQLNIS